MVNENLRNIGSGDKMFGDPDFFSFRDEELTEESHSLGSEVHRTNESKVIHAKKAEQIWRQIVEPENKPHARLW
ncbi:hypothetical protein KAJ89_00930 [Candidatus Parcubacteria bacterium]|nr:hypothetical protein [Candidatus Parcubacteria bacterium]